MADFIEKLQGSPTFQAFSPEDKAAYLSERLPELSPSFSQMPEPDRQEYINTQLMPVLTGSVSTAGPAPYQPMQLPVQQVEPAPPVHQPIAAVTPAPPPIDYLSMLDGLGALGAGALRGTSAGGYTVDPNLERQHPILTGLGDVAGTIGVNVGGSLLAAPVGGPLAVLPTYMATRELNRQADQINSVTDPRTQYNPLGIAAQVPIGLAQALIPGAVAGPAAVRAASGAALGVPFSVASNAVQQLTDYGNVDFKQSLFNQGTLEGMGTDALLAVLTGGRAKLPTKTGSRPIGLGQMRQPVDPTAGGKPPVQPAPSTPQPQARTPFGGASGLQQRAPLQGSVSMSGPRVVPSNPRTIKQAIQEQADKRTQIHRDKVNALVQFIDSLDEFQQGNAIKRMMGIAGGPDTPERGVTVDALRTIRNREAQARKQLQDSIAAEKQKAATKSAAEKQAALQAKIAERRRAEKAKQDAAEQAKRDRQAAIDRARQEKQKRLESIQKSKKKKITDKADLDRLAQKVHELHKANRVNAANKLLRDNFHPNTVALVKDRVAQFKAEARRIDRLASKSNRNKKPRDTDDSVQRVIGDMTDSASNAYYEQPAVDVFDRYGYRMAKDTVDPSYIRVKIGGRLGTIRFKRGAPIGAVMDANRGLRDVISRRLNRKEQVTNLVEDIKQFAAADEGAPAAIDFADSQARKVVQQRESEENSHFERLEADHASLLRELGEAKTIEDVYKLAEEVYHDKWDDIPVEEIEKLSKAYVDAETRLKPKESTAAVDTLDKPEVQKLSGDTSQMLKAGLKESGLSIEQAKKLVTEVDNLGNIDSDPRVKELKAERATLGTKRDAQTTAEKARIDAEIKKIKDARAVMRGQAQQIHPHLREVLSTGWDGKSPTAKQLPVDPSTQLKRADIENLVTNKKALDVIDSAMKQGLSGKGEFASEITGSTDAATKITGKGNIKIPLSEFTPTHYEITKKIDENSPEYKALKEERDALGNKRDAETKAAKAFIDGEIARLAVDTPAVVGYNDQGHIRRHYFDSMEGSKIERFKPLDTEKVVGVHPNVYLGQRDYKVFDVLNKPLDTTIGVKTSDAKATAQQYKDIFTQSGLNDLTKTGQGIINQLLDIRQTAGRVYSDAEVSKMQEAALRELTPQQRKDLYKSITKEDC